eukprot:m.55208 g.55208  ORF g.55208 m.55208 type:complete len:236 (+) comp22034_c1_seq1:156-863(+)
MSFPVLAGDEMREVDLEVTNQLGFHRVMECVATRTADFVAYTLKKERSSTILCVAGKGNNGGNAITCGRILAGRGYTDVRLLLSHTPDNLKGIVGEQFELFKSFGGKVVDRAGALTGATAAIAIDGLLGTGISSSPRGTVAEVITLLNSFDVPVLSCDIPSGLDHVTGEPHEPCVRATWTLNYHVVKSGQIAKQAQSHIGELWTAETNLTFTRFGKDFGLKLQQLYNDSPFVKLT